MRNAQVMMGEPPNVIKPGIIAGHLSPLHRPGPAYSSHHPHITLGGHLFFFLRPDFHFRHTCPKRAIVWNLSAGPRFFFMGDPAEKRPLAVISNSDEAHFWLNGYINKQNCRIWSEANPQVYVETPLHPEKLTVWCALWAGGILLQKR
ncbi:hypothetical protein TNCV_576751 [Trichonephila clavipes]|nr:hypothetical protein TNCV_576751 [Trichonephila clavipes]